MKKSFDLIVIGGGAAGFFGAITAAKQMPQARVLLLERTQQVLSKVKISGGGRCNVTHACFDPAQLICHYPRGSKELRGAFARFQPRDTIEWFKAHGVHLKTEEDGRMFPDSDQSQSIIDCLIHTAEKEGVILSRGRKVENIHKEGEEFILSFSESEHLSSLAVLLATGSHPHGYAFAKACGHSIVPPVPSLFTFQIPDFSLKECAGISARVTISLTDSPFEQTGPLLITHWGFSGPAPLKLSAWGARLLHERGYITPLHVNWVPECNPLETLLGAKQSASQREIGNFNPFHFPRQLWKCFLNRVACDPTIRYGAVSHKQLQHLATLLQKDVYQMEGKITHKEEFVTCGGVDLKEIQFKRMESKFTPGLFFAGEVLNIDGVTGGFNFQNAWTTGWLAGQGVAHLLKTRLAPLHRA